ncbi:FAS1-like dehydratase domain-containing protein [Hypericibacter sp.]|uniref:FAS1-like dehydratase domain-containing protein n=1 Tax=Hypericibacter sp. TaxID=2705401 RepID=UPI003D6D62A9
MNGEPKTDGAEKPFADWVGRRTEQQDIVTPRLDASYRAIFEPHLAAVDDGAVPLGFHWCLSPRIAGMAELGPDGHPAKSRDLPPVPQPRRMWAGGSIETFAPLRVGDQVRLVSTITDVAFKQGRTGSLCFVTLSHDYLTERGLAIRDRQDIVYREAAKIPPVESAGDKSGPARAAARSWPIETSPTLLFRYSAITFNGHRIHYDQPYATGVEGYSDLVVHGPLQATLLFNRAAIEGGRVPKRFDYRGLAPAIVGQPLSVCIGGSGEENLFWTQGPSGRVHMEAKVTLS